jgi:hypothetical protein
LHSVGPENYFYLNCIVNENKKKNFFESVETITFESRVVQLLIRHLEVAIATKHYSNFTIGQ